METLKRNFALHNFNLHLILHAQLHFGSKLTEFRDTWYKLNATEVLPILAMLTLSLSNAHKLTVLIFQGGNLITIPQLNTV